MPAAAPTATRDEPAKAIAGDVPAAAPTATRDEPAKTNKAPAKLFS